VRRDDPREGTGHKRFIGAMNLGRREVLFEHRNVILAADADDIAAGDPREAIITARRPHLALADDEEMGRIARRNKPMRVEHQRLVGARLRRLDARGDAVEL